MADFNKNEEKSNYYIYNWGFSKYGQTGLENCQYTDEPNILLIPPTKDILSISSGEFNSSIIYKDNKTYLYGLNTFGQLGNGSNKEKSKKISNIPLLIQPIKFSKLSIGGGHILAISTENKLYSWGLNIFGQLGLGHIENIDQPTLVEKIGIFNSSNEEYFSSDNIIESKLESNQKIIDIKAGAQHSLILLSDNCIYSCGFAKFGALGYFCNNTNELETNNIFTKFELDKHFEDFKQRENKITKIAAGFSHSGCIINDKIILIWGINENIIINGYKKFNISELINSKSEANKNDKISIKDFQIGKDFMAILTNTGNVLTEGDNSLGQLGRITNNKHKLFDIVELPEKIKQISVGYEFIYSISENNKIYAWGCNKYGQIPGYTKNICYQPFYVDKITKLNPIYISCGGYHITSLCNKYLKLNDIVKFFKNIPLNKCFNFEEYKRKEIYYSKISDTVEMEQNMYEKMEAKEKEYQKILKDYEKKEKKLKKEKDGKDLSIGPEDYENIEIEKLLDEDVKYEELVFPENCLIGSGATGEVKKAFWRKTLVSVKFLKANQQRQMIPFFEEFNLLKQLRHPNILLYIGGNITKEPYFLITEYCENGNLFEFLHGKDAPELEDVERLNLALEIAQGVNYLHSFRPPILHRDLKSLNILLDKNYVAKVCDFGLAKLRNEHMTKLRGTYQWMAPEVITKEDYTEKADVYSFGIILWEFWSKDPPYKGIKAKEVAIKVKNDKNYRPTIPEEVPEEISDLIELCWDSDPDKRPTFLEIINFLNEYLKNL